MIRAMLTAVLLLAIASGALAQTATPTPTVAPALSESFVEFENLSAPVAQIVNGSTTTHMNRTVLVVASLGSVRFSTTASYAVFYYNSSVSAGSVTMTVSVNNVPTTIQVFDTEIYSSIWVNLGVGGTKEVIITRSPGTINLYLDYMVLLNGSLIAAPTSTPGATPTAITPTPFVIFIPQPVTPSVATPTPTPSLSDYVEVTAEVDSELVTQSYRVDYVVSVADIFMGVMLFAILAVLIVLAFLGVINK